MKKSTKIFLFVGFILTLISGIFLVRLIKLQVIDFEQETGITLPESFKYKKAGVRFFSRYDTYLVFSLNEEDFDSLKNAPPPWGKWKNGPLEAGPGIWLRFGTSGVGYGGSPPDLEYGGDQKLETLFNSPDIIYSLNTENEQAQHGDILILEPNEYQVWYARWSS